MIAGTETFLKWLIEHWEPISATGLAIALGAGLIRLWIVCRIMRYAIDKGCAVDIVCNRLGGMKATVTEKAAPRVSEFGVAKSTHAVSGVGQS